MGAACCWAAAPVRISDNEVSAESPVRPSALRAPGFDSSWASGKALASTDDVAATVAIALLVASAAALPPCDLFSRFAL